MMQDWQNLMASWQATLRAIERLGGATSLEAARQVGIEHSDVWGLHLEPPASQEEIARVERAVSSKLPAELTDIFLNHASRIEFRWQLPTDMDCPDPLDQIFSGGFSLSLNAIPEINDAYKLMAEVFDNPTPTFDLMWKDKLAIMEGMIGDFYAFDVQSEVGPEVIYLSHEDGLGHGHVLGADFSDFLKRWTAIGCPGPEDWQWAPFTSGPRSLLEPSGETARQWRKIIALELPRQADLRKG